MKKRFVTLNRIAATCKGNPLKVSPLQVLQEFFSYAKPAEHVKAFDEFCRAALKEQYCWRRGSPANALHYAQQLELLLEVAYLLYLKPLKYRGCFKKYTTWLLVTSNGYANEDDFLSGFFKQASLQKWKRWLQCFTHAAIADSSVADEITAVHIYVFIDHIKQLLHLAAMIVNARGNIQHAAC
jgi:hypothetical protein